LETNENDKSKIVLPLPENILKILDKEKSVRNETFLKVATDQECQDHLLFLAESIHWIERIGMRQTNDNEEILVQGPITRIYNDISTALSLMLSGFQQVSVMPQRDMLECFLLIWKFTLERASIARWKSNSDAKEFQPFQVRKYIEDHETEFPKEFIKKMRFVYGSLSRRGVHCTHNGINLMLTKERNGERSLSSGPLFNQKMLKDSLSILAMLTSIAAVVTVKFFGGMGSPKGNLQAQFDKYFIKSLDWLQRYGATKI